MASQPDPVGPLPTWGPIAVTTALLTIALILFGRDQYPALSGSIIGATVAYWLPTRPNRAPPA